MDRRASVSKQIVKRETLRAHGTPSCVTPCRGQRSRGTHACAVPGQHRQVARAYSPCAVKMGGSIISTTPEDGRWEANTQDRRVEQGAGGEPVGRLPPAGGPPAWIGGTAPRPPRAPRPD